MTLDATTPQPWKETGPFEERRRFVETCRGSDEVDRRATTGGLSRLAVWWIQLGILPERILRGHPEQNGRHETMHRTLKAETARLAASSFTAQQRVFDSFKHEYNYERPHEALGQVEPAKLFRPSLRSYPRST